MRIANAARPPITPPTMAPVWLLLFVVVVVEEFDSWLVDEELVEDLVGADVGLERVGDVAGAEDGLDRESEALDWVGLDDGDEGVCDATALRGYPAPLQ